MTRGLLIVVKNKQNKLAAFSNSDSYPEGLGTDILGILKPDGAVDSLYGNIDKVTMYMAEDIENDCYEAAGGKKAYRHLPFSTQELVKSAVLTGRKAFVGAADHALIKIIKGEPLNIEDSSGFAANSLFCEYAYVIDLDFMTFEIYKGFNPDKLKQGERFKYLEKDMPEDGIKWYPVKFLKGYPLAKLPEEDKFLEDLDEKHTGMKDLQIEYKDENGKTVHKSYDTIMDFIDKMELNADNMQMSQCEVTMYRFFENPFNSGKNVTMEWLLKHCKEMVK